MNKYYQISFYFNGGVRASYHQQYDSVELAQQAINAAFTKKELLQIDGSVINTGKALGYAVTPANTVTPDQTVIWDML
ncbi:hypothetical protein MK904_13045 [Loigolactobacillus coryniformis]|uniref:DUF2922 domain-containing protein n=3 Tax=Loigolactobacillus coryniformis TaxID=1610 RepID=A0A0R1F3T0_9LACO|nr:hypothetical protein [Loigolactobacillus coryniformis]MDT3391827.1 hypothetical protein [Bacillota bacterium]OEH90373.1 hypothetical protein ATO00_04690 [Loigolactobacillus coryniformis subsp. coryniformis]RRG05510.1 MAG: hypothetical protein DUD28_06015 [Lactobacillus sp.]ATO43094.1 hypothetical protein LC20004_03900 [Loigolactobacillus coryniformis subsp. torquens DSM 20004 = KCTC 3535]ATO54848.1 hypothetical protein LC20001_04090 [Loigolactobacillus coryniformis subsp. coryniformis KCTC 